MTNRNGPRHHSNHMSRPNQRHQAYHQNSNQLSQQNNVRPMYHGHASNSYATSNYRHSSTTSTATSATDPSQTQSQSISSDEDGCSNFVCYSYLVAIISSFLVVLGIYLSITRFNIQYFYVSLVGISITAISPCLYFISNIRSSKLARRKQQRTNNDFYALSASNDSTNINSNNNLDRRQEIAHVTHILTNRTLSGNAATNRNEDNVPNSSAIVEDNDDNSTQSENQNMQSNPSQQPQIPEQTLSENGNTNENSTSISEVDGTQDNNQQVIISIPQSDELETSIRPTNSQHHEVSSPSEQIAKLTCQTKSIGDGAIIVMNDAPSDGVAIASDANNDNLQSNQHLPSDTTQLSDDSMIIRIDLTNLPETSSQQLTSSVPNSTGPQQSTTMHLGTNADLINLESNDATNKPTINRRKASRNQHSQRASNTRRTLVMGLSGEEEMVEINEDDLDNMTMLPPSYESLANNPTINSETRP